MANPNPISSLLLVLLLSSSSAWARPPTAYELLQSFGFPAGILPRGVSSYLLGDDGSFEVYLGDLLDDCTFKVEGGYQLDYKRRITGRVEKDAIHSLSGVSVKVLFVWFSITDVVRDGDDLKFFVGPLSATFDVDNFEECPECGCGFDCRKTPSVMADQ